MNNFMPINSITWIKWTNILKGTKTAKAHSKKKSNLQLKILPERKLQMTSLMISGRNNTNYTKTLPENYIGKNIPQFIP